MKICFIAPANNYHTKKWAKWFISRGHEVHIISFINEDLSGAKVHFINTGASSEGSDISKIKYLLHALEIKKIVRSIKPDIVNVHYATSYGTAAALAGIKSYILSVWGMDIYDFPQKSWAHKELLKYSLRKATKLYSTSEAMANEGKKYTNKSFMITPFGVDMDLFSPQKRERAKEDEKLIIGTVKGLTEKYGISYLLKATSIVRKTLKVELELRIAGDGPEKENYKKLARELEIDDITNWLGFISQEDAAYEWANMDIAVIPSTLESESFGVSAVEAQACGTPLIISDIPGLMEATIPNITSIVVKRKNEEQLARAIIELYENKELREELSIRGRENALNKFEMNKCFSEIEKSFEQFANLQGEQL